ncbi:head-tail connector protein [Brachyspira pilosicoli]|uniref:head-tail connector protein n=1 Tax=Brachyspira pilosicoli TaxID=52584 RepID=UPI001CA59192|nr:head-tail connector protein [Brachyspira pilosicoli]MBW5382334.1 phage gp6-like head-tail connector protein [Brachyspira pilosicoli]
MSSKPEDINENIDIDVSSVAESGDDEEKKRTESPPSDVNHSDIFGLEVSEDDKIVTLSEFKKFLNLEGIDYDDDILQLTLDSAISYCNKANETEYKRSDCPPEVRYAILGLAAHYFETKTGEASQSEDVALKGVHRLLTIARENITL